MVEEEEFLPVDGFVHVFSLSLLCTMWGSPRWSAVCCFAASLAFLSVFSVHVEGLAWRNLRVCQCLVEVC